MAPPHSKRISLDLSIFRENTTRVINWRCGYKIMCPAKYIRLLYCDPFTAINNINCYFAVIRLLLFHSTFSLVNICQNTPAERLLVYIYCVLCQVFSNFASYLCTIYLLYCTMNIRNSIVLLFLIRQLDRINVKNMQKKLSSECYTCRVCCWLFFFFFNEPNKLNPRTEAGTFMNSPQNRIVFYECFKKLFVCKLGLDLYFNCDSIYLSRCVINSFQVIEDDINYFTQSIFNPCFCIFINSSSFSLRMQTILINLDYRGSVFISACILL